MSCRLCQQLSVSSLALLQEGGDMVMHVGIRRLGELVQVVTMRVSQGSWCWWWLNGCLVSGPCAESWQIEDDGDGDQAADGAHKWQPPQPMFMPLSCFSCLWWSPEQECDGEWRGVMAALSRLMGWVGVREAMDWIEERGGRAEHQLAVWRWGGAWYVVVWLFSAARSCFEVQDGRSSWSEVIGGGKGWEVHGEVT